MWHPWRALRELTHVTLHWQDLPEGLLGVTDHPSQTIVLTTGLTQAERRCVLDHELEHIRRGPVPGWLQPREEAAVDDISARRLIPFADLVSAMLWSHDDDEAAHELWVSVDVVRARLHGLTALETTELNRRLDEAELRLP